VLNDSVKILDTLRGDLIKLVVGGEEATCRVGNPFPHYTAASRPDPHVYDVGFAVIDGLLAYCDGTAWIYVGTPVPASLSVSPSAPSVGVGSGVQLTPTVISQLGTPMTGVAITWQSDNPAVATVSGSGLVTGVAIGSATITATINGTSLSDPTPVTVGADTRPRRGVGPAVLQAGDVAGLWASLTPIAGSANGSRVAGSSGSPLTANPTGTNYTWFACLASSAPSGVTFNTPLGPEGWNGAGLAGQNGGASPIPSNTYLTYTDPVGNAWKLFRQDYYAAPPTFWTT
jgi:hypothetical protein